AATGAGRRRQPAPAASTRIRVSDIGGLAYAGVWLSSYVGHGYSSPGGGPPVQPENGRSLVIVWNSGPGSAPRAAGRSRGRGGKDMLGGNRSVLLVGLLALTAPGQAKPPEGGPPPTLMLQGPPGMTDSLALSADGKLLVIGTTDAARLWDAASGREIRAF